MENKSPPKQKCKLLLKTNITADMKNCLLISEIVRLSDAACNRNGNTKCPFNQILMNQSLCIDSSKLSFISGVVSTDRYFILLGEKFKVKSVIDKIVVGRSNWMENACISEMRRKKWHVNCIPKEKLLCAKRNRTDRKVELRFCAKRLWNPSTNYITEKKG